MSSEPIVYNDDGISVYRAYSLGGCQLSLAAARMGEGAWPVKFANFQKALDESSSHEAQAIAAYQQVTGHDVLWQQKEVELRLAWDKTFPKGMTPVGNLMAIVRGHLDGLDKQTDDILEIKNFGETYFKLYNSGGFDALPGILGRQYRWQKAIYGHATQRNVREVVMLKNAPADAHLEDILIIGPAMSPQDIVPMEDITEKVRFIEECAANDVLPECDGKCKPGGDWDHVHDFPSAKVGDQQLVELTARYMEVKKLLGREPKDGKPGTGLLGEKAELSELIKSQYGDGSHTAGQYTVHISTFPSYRPDMKWIKEHHPEVHQESLRESQTTRLQVTGGNKKKEEAG